jgi:hypothetical protein
LFDKLIYRNSYFIYSYFLMTHNTQAEMSGFGICRNKTRGEKLVGSGVRLVIGVCHSIRRVVHGAGVPWWDGGQQKPLACRRRCMWDPVSAKMNTTSAFRSHRGCTSVVCGEMICGRVCGMTGVFWKKVDFDYLLSDSF